MSVGSRRLVSLDAFRGLTIAGMILVDNPGNWTSVFPPLVHAEWNGCSLADLVFPWFLVILGAALPFAFERRRETADTAAIHRRILRRTAALIGLGLFLNAMAAWPTLATLRIPGVLQRIGIVYLATAVICLHVAPRRRGILAGLLLIGHWAVLALSMWSGRFDLTADHNVSAALDRAVFDGHLLTAIGDPEGLLGTVSATATALVGTLAGDWLRRHRETPVVRLAAAGLGVTAAGYAWSWLLPMNKALWTGSYALFAAGLAIVALAFFHGMLDAGNEPKWIRPLLWLGVNPLAIYFASEVGRQLLDRPLGDPAARVTIASWMFWNVLRPVVPDALDEQWVALVYGVIAVTVWILAAGQLHRRRIRLHV